MTDYTVTIPPSSVSGSSKLLNFPLRIDMSVLPASFFTEARYDGGNVRAFNSANQQIPLEVQDFRKFSGGGTVWVKSDLSASSNTTITLRTVTGANTLERSSTYGGAAVWADYHAVYLGAYNNYANAQNASDTWSNGGQTHALQDTGQIGPRFTDDFHQGVAWDAENDNFVLIDNNLLVLYDSAFNEIARNSDPCGDANNSTSLTVNHACDGTVIGDYFVMPINNYPASNQICISVFNKTTLAHVSSTIVADANISGLCYDPIIDRIVTCSWGAQSTDWDVMYKFTFNQYNAAITADGSISLSPLDVNNKISSAQGIEYHMGRYWVSDDYRRHITPVELNGAYDTEDGLGIYSGNQSSQEGLTVYRDGLVVLIDPWSGNDPATGNPYYIGSLKNSFLNYWVAQDGYDSNYNSSASTFGWFTTDTAADTDGVFTLGVTVTPKVVDQQAVVSFYKNGSGNTRSTAVLRTSAGGFKIGAWDSANGWLMATAPVDITVGQTQRFHIVSDTNRRDLYIGGLAVGFDSSSHTPITGLDKAGVGTEDDDHFENASSIISFAYVRNGVLSADWIATEHAMINSPSTFMSGAYTATKYQKVKAPDVVGSTAYTGGTAVNQEENIQSKQIDLNGLTINPKPAPGWVSKGDPAGDMYQRPDLWPCSMIWDFEGSKIAENKHENAKIVQALALNGTIGIPMVTWYYRDDGAEVNPVSLPTEELANEYNHDNGEYRAFWSMEVSGTAAAIQPYGRNGSVFEWFWDGDNVPFGRLSTVVGSNDRGCRLEFGSGGGGSVNPGLLPYDQTTWPYTADETDYEPDWWISREESNLTTIKVNNTLTQRWKDDEVALINDTKLLFENSSGGWANVYSLGSPATNDMRLVLDSNVQVIGNLTDGSGHAIAGGGIVGSFTGQQNASQSFTSDTDAVLEFGNITDDPLSGWDSTNNHYECDAALNGAYATINVNTEMSGGVSGGSLMKIQVQWSNNNGVNWVPAGQDIGPDFYGNKAITSLLKVQTGTLIRARVKFFGNNRVSFGNAGVNMKMIFTK